MEEKEPPEDVATSKKMLEAVNELVDRCPRKKNGGACQENGGKLQPGCRDQRRGNQLQERNSVSGTAS